MKIGNHDLIIDDDGSAATPGVKSFSVLNGPFNDYIFRTDDGMPRSGDLKIVISSTPNAIVTTRLNSFGTNTDI